MNRYFAMLKKEAIEYRYILRMPLWIGLCSLALIIALFMNTALQDNLLFELKFGGDLTDVHLNFGQGVNTLIVGGAGLLSILLSTMYFPKTLRKPRQEGSLMFWRSMPVSDVDNHIVKLVFGLAMIPLACALLVLGADLLLWVLNLTLGQKLTLVMEQASLSYSLIHWLGFWLRMIWAGLLLVPLALIALALSQRTNAPLVVMFVAVYVLKWGALALFNFDGVSRFFSAIFAIPTQVVLDSNPLGVLHAMSWYGWLIYWVMGGIGAALSLHYSKTLE